jgi:hypothetical protein
MVSSTVSFLYIEQATKHRLPVTLDSYTARRTFLMTVYSMMNCNVHNLLSLATCLQAISHFDLENSSDTELVLAFGAMVEGVGSFSAVPESKKTRVRRHGNHL